MSSDKSGSEEKNLDDSKDEEKDGKSLLNSFKENWQKSFIVGIIIGISLAFIISFIGFSMTSNKSENSVSMSKAGSNLEEFINKNENLIVPEGSNFTVGEISSNENINMYEAKIRITGTFRNQTINENGTVYLTKNGKYAFFSDPYNLSVNISRSAQRSRR